MTFASSDGKASSFPIFHCRPTLGKKLWPRVAIFLKNGSSVLGSAGVQVHELLNARGKGEYEVMELKIAVSVFPTNMNSHGEARSHTQRLGHVEGLFRIVATGIHATGAGSARGHQGDRHIVGLFSVGKIGGQVVEIGARSTPATRRTGRCR